MVVAAVRGHRRRQLVMVVVERWPSSLSDGGGDCRYAVVVVVAEWWWLVVVERWWLLSLSNMVGLAAKQEVVVFGCFGCALLVVGGMLEVVVAVRAVVVVGC